MTVTYDTDTKNARMTVTRDAVADGTFEIRQGTTVLVTFGFTTAGGTIANGTWTIAFDAATVNAAADGVADNAVIKDSAGTVRVNLTVSETGGAGDVQLINTNIAVGQPVEITSAAISD